MKIIGAGLSGLLAGAMIPGSTIYEKQGSLPHNHGAILRFRSDKISRALGIPFKKVRVTKAIWYDGQEVQPTPRIQNMYSHKVLGEYNARSIRDIEPVDRWIAPDDFIEQLAKRCTIVFHRPYPNQVPAGKPLISTIPMPVLINQVKPLISTIPMPVMINQVMDNPEYKFAKFKRAPIWTRTLTFEDNVDLYQTIYFPGPETCLYRASFTGNKLILEYIRNPNETDDVAPVWQAFGLEPVIEFEPEKTTKKEEYGKIVPIDNLIRRSIMAQLTREHNIYSLGRYAVWRNILLDDVFDDIRRIKEMVQMDSYSRHMALAEEKS